MKQIYLPKLIYLILAILVSISAQSADFAEPTTPATALTIDGTTDNSIDISWTRGDGDGVLIVARAAATANVAPTDDTGYTADAAFGAGSTTGTGNFVVYDGTGTSVSVTGLNSLETYHFYAYEYSTGGTPDPDYLLTTPATNSATTDCSLPSTQPTGISFGSITDASMNVSWTGGDGDETLVIARAGGAVNASPVVGMSYTANSAFGTGSEIGTGNYVVYAGNGSNVPVTALSGSTTYHFAIYEYNVAGNCYLLTSPTTDNQQTDCAPPSGQASNITFSNTNAGSMQVNWTRGTPSGDGVIVIARANNPVSHVPVIGDNYAGDIDADFSAATNFSGNRIVFRGNGTNVTVSGLSPTTTYHFAVYEYNDAGNCYNLTSPATNSQSTTGVDNNSTITNGSSNNTLSSMAGIGSKATVFTFEINDIGGDGRDTDFSAMVFRETGGQIGDLRDLLAGAQLSDGTHSKTTNVTINADNITITSIPNNNDLGDVNDGATKTYTLSVWFLSSYGGALPTTVDGKRLIFSIDESDITTPSNDSQFAPGQAATSDDNSAPNNEIAVTATELNFVQQPSNTFVLSPINPAVTVEATDARGNRDLDYTGSVELSSTGTLQSTPSASFSNGLGTYANIIHTVAQNNRTLSTTNSSPSLTEAGPSNTFDITGPANMSDIIENGAFSYPTNITYVDYQEATDITISGSSLEVAAFTLRDGGSFIDGDVFPTVLTDIEFTLTNPTYIRRVALYGDLDDNGSYETELGETTPSGNTVTFNSLSLTAPSGGSIDFALRASFTTTVVDNSQFGFTITNASSDYPTNSGFSGSDAGGAASSTSGFNNRIEVIATTQQFTTQPDALEVQGSPIIPQPIVAAVDDNGNQDLDYGGAVTVTNAGTLPMANVPTTYSGGSLTFSGFTYNGSGDGTLTVASAGLTDAVSNSVTVDGVPPTAVLDDNHADNIVRDADNVAITVTFTENDQIDEVTPPTISIGSVVTNAPMVKSTNLNWTYNWNVPAGNDGAAAVTINATDRAGNAVSTVTAGTGSTSYTIDNTNPTVSSITRLDPNPTASTSVQYQVQFLETVNNVDVTDFTPTIGSVTGISGSGTTYTVTVGSLGGLNDILRLDVLAGTASLNDVAGNPFTSDFTSGETYEIDNLPPDIGTLAPADNSFNNAIGSNLTITFDEDVTVGTGNITLREGTNIIETFPIGTASFNGTNQFTVNPAADLAEGTTYNVIIDAGAVVDIAGNAFTGINDATTWNFTTYAPPVISSISSFGCVGATINITGQFLTGVTHITFDGGPVTITGGFTVISDTQISATVPNYGTTTLNGTITLLKNDGGGPNPDDEPTTSSGNIAIGPAAAGPVLAGTIENNPVCSEGSVTSTTIKVNIRGGQPPYSVNIGAITMNNYYSDNDFTITPDNIGSNIYAVNSVTDANGCTVPIAGLVTDSYEIVRNAAPVVDAGGGVSSSVDYCPSSAPNLDFQLDALQLGGVAPSFSYASGVAWTSDGDGSFDDPTLLNATYTIQTNDLIKGFVTFTITTTGNASPCTAASDVVTVNFVSNATADPGGTGGILDYCWDGSDPAIVQLNGSVTDGTPLWQTTTGGTFNDPNKLNPTYTFSPAEMSTLQADISLTPSGGSCGTGQEAPLTINLISAPTVNFQSPLYNSVCVGETGVAYKVTNNAGSTYNWTVPTTGGTSFVGQGTSTIIVDWGTTAGDYNIEVIETDNNDCQSNSVVLPVTVNELPVVSITSPLERIFDIISNPIELKGGVENSSGTIDTLYGDFFGPGVFYINDGGKKWFFDPSQAGIGDHDIAYSYTDGNNCSNQTIETFTVRDGNSDILNQDTNATMADEFCEDDLPFTIEFDENSDITPKTDGTFHFYGYGVSNNNTASDGTLTATFDPNAAFDSLNYNNPEPVSGEIKIYYQDTVEQTILISLFPLTFKTFRIPRSLGQKSVKINAKPNTNQTLREVENRFFCEDDPDIILLVDNDVISGVANMYSLSHISSVENINPSTYKFKPGSVTFPLSNTDLNNDFSPIPVDITYTYTASTGCTSEKTVQVPVYQKPPSPTVTETSACIIDGVIPTVEAIGWDEIANVPISDVQIKWFEVNDVNSDPIEGAGKYLPQSVISSVASSDKFYVAQVVNGCVSETVEVSIERIDSFDFSVDNSCLEAGTPLTFTKSTGSTSLQGIRWKIDGNVELQQTDPNITNTFQYQFTNPGLYEVSLEIISQNGCIDEITKPVVVTPQEVAQNNDVYFENFESNDGSGWVATGTNSTWAYGAPGAGNNTISLGNNNGSTIWITGLDGSYAQAEESYLYSPCFDFSGLDRPMIAFDSWTSTIDKLDGVILQYSTNGINGPWTRLGDFDNGQQSGIDWYDRRDISSNPGNQNVGFYGWSGENSGWVNSKHRLDVIPQADRSNVIFRFAFKSSAGAQDKLDGFAIDNVFIGNRTRVVLVENFTNTSQAQNTLNEADFLKNFSFGSSELVKINYHTAFPGDDPMNDDNSAVPSSRALYYGVSEVPRARLDGGKRDDLGTLFSSWGEPEYNIRSLNNSPFEISVNIHVNNNALEIEANLTALVDIAPNAVVHVAVVEKSITIGELNISGSDVASGETDFQYVVKQMLPSSSGTKFPDQILQGETVNVNLSWVPQVPIYDEGDIAIVVFIQDESTREVYQSNFTDNIILPPTVTGTEDNAQPLNFSLHPNPVNGTLNISIASDSKADEIQIFDSYGKLIFSKKVESGERQITVNTSEFASGLYHVQMIGKNAQPQIQRLMVVHR